MNNVVTKYMFINRQCRFLVNIFFSENIGNFIKITVEREREKMLIYNY